MGNYNFDQIVEREFFQKSSHNADNNFERLPNNCTIYIAMHNNPASQFLANHWYGDWYLLEDTDRYVVSDAEIAAGTYPRHAIPSPDIYGVYHFRHHTYGLVVSPDETKFRYFSHGIYNRTPKPGAVPVTIPSFIIPPLLSINDPGVDQSIPGWWLIDAPGIGKVNRYPETYGLYRQGVHF